MFITRLLAILISCYLATLCEGNPFLATFRRYTKLKCSTKKCSNVHACVVVHGVETCVCSHSCRHSIRTGPLCGTDGMTYTHLCHLRRKECYTRKFITVKHYGKCQGKIGRGWVNGTLVFFNFTQHKKQSLYVPNFCYN